MSNGRRFASLALLLLFAVTAVAQDNKPRLAIESFKHDFGEIKAGTPLKHTFKIRNEGNLDLVIQNVAPS